MDEDFFKDYPVHADAQQPTTEPPQPAPTGFVLSDPADSDSQPNGHAAAPPAAAVADEPLTAIPMGEPAPPPPEDAEPECAAVTEWRAQFAKGLEEKLEFERTTKAQRAEKAKQTLATMHARWEAAAKDAKDANLKAEKEFVMKRDGVISRMSKPGEQPAWDIVPELVDMTGKYKEGARDTSRMRQVLMRMKTT